MKIRPSADYYVRVRPQDWEADPATSALYEGIVDVYLNYSVRVTFVPDVSALAPPWDAPTDPPPLSAGTSAETVRLYEGLTSAYVVTPNAARAGTEDRFVWPADGDPDFPTTVFYVTPAEFARYHADLVVLSDVVGGHEFTRLSELPDHEVLDFLDRRVVASSWLHPLHATTLGR